MAAEEAVIEVTGVGPTRERAFAEAMAQVQTGVAEAVRGIPIRIEPSEVTVLSASENRRTERFMGLFLPRTRSRFALSLRVTAAVTVFPLADVDFTVDGDGPTTIQRILQMR